jgi:transcriptional regulator with XRE-family HTH domain
MELKTTQAESNGADLLRQLAARVRAIREEKGWSQRQTARRLRVSYNRINRLENARLDPKFLFLARLASVFGMTLQALLAPVAPSEGAE